MFLVLLGDSDSDDDNDEQQLGEEVCEVWEEGGGSFQPLGGFHSFVRRSEKQVRNVRRSGCPDCGQPGLFSAISLHMWSHFCPEAVLWEDGAAAVPSPRALGVPDHERIWEPTRL